MKKARQMKTEARAGEGECGANLYNRAVYAFLYNASRVIAHWVPWRAALLRASYKRPYACCVSALSSFNVSFKLACAGRSTRRAR